MKKILILILSFFIICGFNTKTDTFFKIEETGDVSVRINIRFDNELLTKIIYNSVELNNSVTDPKELKKLETYNITYDSTEKLDFLKFYLTLRGKTVTDLEDIDFRFHDYVENNYVGYTLILPLKHIDNLLSDEEIIINNILDLDKKEIFNKKEEIYSTVLDFNLVEDLKLNGFSCSDLDLKNNIYVDLPDEYIETNAHSIDSTSKILSWNFIGDEDGKVSFSFKFSNKNIYKTDKPILLILVFVITTSVVVISIRNFIKNK